MTTEAPDAVHIARKGWVHAPINAESCTRRLDNLEQASSEAKGLILQSIAQDICTAFQTIAKYAETGVLEDEHTKMIDEVITAIRDTDVKQRRYLEKMNRRLRRERHRAHQRLVILTSIGDALGREAKERVERLTYDLREARGKVARLQVERDFSREWAMRKGILTDAKDEEADGESELATGDITHMEVQKAVDDREDKGTD
ncbi:hypothetical protein N7535_007100 [Penicillium sp. DV-2018c]|nr:hypothetical protein N7461_006805 [Penicillium sp. DV-2018c]KAJ5567794.1 hypothetical protein N7535_007100 [Penicillium sp. DV-2018c]